MSHETPLSHPFVQGRKDTIGSPTLTASLFPKCAQLEATKCVTRDAKFANEQAGRSVSVDNESRAATSVTRVFLSTHAISRTPAPLSLPILSRHSRLVQFGEAAKRVLATRSRRRFRDTRWLERSSSIAAEACTRVPAGKYTQAALANMM